MNPKIWFVMFSIAAHGAPAPHLVTGPFKDAALCNTAGAALVDALTARVGARLKGACLDNAQLLDADQLLALAGGAGPKAKRQ
jgi:hypothetical protein